MLRRKAEQLGILENPDLVVRPLPLPPVEAMLLWHPTMTHHKAHRWMREVLVNSCRAALAPATCGHQAVSANTPTIWNRASARPSGGRLEA